MKKRYFYGLSLLLPYRKFSLARLQKKEMSNTISVNTNMPIFPHSSADFGRMTLKIRKLIRPHSWELPPSPNRNRRSHALFKPKTSRTTDPTFWELLPTGIEPKRQKWQKNEEAKSSFRNCQRAISRKSVSSPAETQRHSSDQLAGGIADLLANAWLVNYKDLNTCGAITLLWSQKTYLLHLWVVSLDVNAADGLPTPKLFRTRAWGKGERKVPVQALPESLKIEEGLQSSCPSQSVPELEKYDS